MSSAREFYFLCRGELRPGVTRAVAGSNLARLYGGEAADFESLLDGSTQFLRTPLDEFTARAYQDAFTRCGLRGYCKHVSALAAELAPPEPAVTHAGEMPLDESEAARAHAFRRLKWAVLSLFIVSFVDGYLTANSVVTPFGIWTNTDIGLLPYLLVAALFAYAGAPAAISKGYPAWLGSLLGATTIPGLAVLLLLRDRVKDTGPTRLQQVFGLGMLAAGAFWFSTQLTTQYKAQSLEFPAAAQISRLSYPNQESLANAETVQLLKNQLLEFLRTGVDVAAGARPDDASVVFDELMLHASAFMEMAQYQYFLGGFQDRVQLERDEIDAFRHEILTVLAERINTHQSRRLVTNFEDWAGLFHRANNDDLTWQSSTIQRAIIDLKVKGPIAWRERMAIPEDVEDSIGREPRSFRLELTCADFPATAWSCAEGQLPGTFVLSVKGVTHAELKGRTLVLAPSFKAYRRHKGKSRFNPVRTFAELWRVGGTLSDKYIANVRDQTALFYRKIE